jgi:hypothetical protein
MPTQSRGASKFSHSMIVLYPKSQETSVLIQARLSIMSLYRSFDALDKAMVDFAELKQTIGSVVFLFNFISVCLYSKCVFMMTGFIL